MITAGGRYFHCVLKCIEKLASRPPARWYGFQSRPGKEFFPLNPFILALASTHPPIEWVPGFFAGGKAPGREGLRLVPRLRVSRTLLLLPLNMPSGRRQGQVHINL